MVRRGSTVRVRQRASSDPPWFLGIADLIWRSPGQQPPYGNEMVMRCALLAEQPAWPRISTPALRLVGGSRHDPPDVPEDERRKPEADSSQGETHFSHGRHNPKSEKSATDCDGGDLVIGAGVDRQDFTAIAEVEPTAGSPARRGRAPRAGHLRFLNAASPGDYWHPWERRKVPSAQRPQNTTFRPAFKKKRYSASRSPSSSSGSSADLLAAKSEVDRKRAAPG